MILITGGAGYIGSHANKYLSSRGQETVVFDNLIYGHKEFAKWGHFVHADLADINAIRSCFDRFPIDSVMHFSSFAYVGESVTDPQKYYRNNIITTLNLLEVMLERQVKDFIFSSTCATYGIPKQMPITEDAPQAPINPYGRTKLMIEQILEDYSAAYGIRYAALRYFNAAGADPDCEIGEWHLPETHIIPLVLDAALGARDSISVFGSDYSTPDGTCVRDYVHVNDLAQAHALALEYLRHEKTNLRLNLGNGNGASVMEVVESARRASKRDIKVVMSGRRPGDPDILIGSSDRAKSVLGWEPRFAEIDTIISTAWNWRLRLQSEFGV